MKTSFKLKRKFKVMISSGQSLTIYLFLSQYRYILKILIYMKQISELCNT